MSNLLTTGPLKSCDLLSDNNFNQVHTPNLSFNYRLRLVCALVIQWQNVHYFVRPKEVSKCLKFPPRNFVPWACTDEFKHVEMNFFVTVTEGVVHGVYKVVTQSSFGVTQQHKVT